MPLISDDIKRQAQVLWDYRRLDVRLKPSDPVLALGSQDERVAERAYSNAAQVSEIELLPH